MNEDVVGASPTGDAPTTSEWLTILLPTKVRLILESWRYTGLALAGFDISPNQTVQWQVKLSARQVNFGKINFYKFYTVFGKISSCVCRRSEKMNMWSPNFWDKTMPLNCQSKPMPSKVWDEITYPFPNFNGATGELWKLVSNFISYLIMDVITYPCCDIS